MQSRFIKTAIALSISAISSVSFAAKIQYGAVTIDDKLLDQVLRPLHSQVLPIQAL